MCGLAGVISQNRDVVTTALKAMVCAQIHRGPDDSGESIAAFGDGWLGLGHRRLSILDLSSAGHQPMVHPQTGDQIVFNGEIYNVQELRRELQSTGAAFQGHSDTEVLLHGLTRWGPDYIHRLEGMYVFAYFNQRERQLLLARDPLGIKPLYIASVRDTFLFASEVRALLAPGLVTRAIDRQGLAGYLAYGAVPEPCTFIQGVREFPAGCCQTFDSQKVRTSSRQYWHFPPIKSVDSEQEAVAQVRERLSTAVRDHLISDVPVGVFLSSGLDSTIVAALAAEHTHNLRTFTVGYLNQNQMDQSESKLAAETAGIIGTQHTDIQVNGSAARIAAEAWLQSMDQPSIDGLNTYIISKVVRERGIVVALSGLGGDELFGGYATFSRIPRLMNIMRRLRWLPARGRSALASMATITQPAAVREKVTDLARTNGDIVSLFLNGRRVMSNQQLTALGIEPREWGLTEAYLPPNSIDDLPLTGQDVVYDTSILESHLYMRNTLLRDSDVNGMSHSLEIRVPMLDRRLIDYIYALPGSVRLPSGKADKHLLRRAFASKLRPALTEQKKRGFTLPIGEWMKGPLRELCETGITHLKSLNILRPQGVDLVWKSFLGQSDQIRWSRAFSLCVLGLSCKRLTQ